MTTLAIIGAGIAGRSVLWALAKQSKNFSRIVIFDAQNFLEKCSLNSTATVALRGITKGHSNLGDTLVESFENFKAHFLSDSPEGVFPIRQFSAVSIEDEKFKNRFPESKLSNGFLDFKFKKEILLNDEESFLIDPSVYLDWLLKSAKIQYEFKNTLVKQTQNVDGKILITDTENNEENFDKVIYTTGAYQKSFNPDLKTKVVQGSFFSLPWDFGDESFSLTLDGANFVYQAHKKTVLIGSTSLECSHSLAPEDELLEIYRTLEKVLAFKLPEVDFSLVRVGLREKAPKRSPYLIQRDQEFFLGGYYKNGFSLGLYMAQKLVSKL